MATPTKPKGYFSRKNCLTASGCGLLVAITLCLLLVFGAVYLQIRHLTTPYRAQNLGVLNRVYVPVTLTTTDGVPISGWYVPGTRPQAIVLVHGIHANRGYLIPQAEFLADAGYHVLLIDLRGHGFSGDAAMTYGYREALDVQAAVDYLAALPEVEQVGAIGHSLGGAAVVRAAATDERIQAMVVQSSYSSLSRAIDESFENFSAFPQQPFATMLIAAAEMVVEGKVSEVNSARDLAAMSPRPVLIIHSIDDNLFPPHHAQEMYAAAQNPKYLWLVEGLPHINPMTGHEAMYKQKVLEFFETAFSR